MEVSEEKLRSRSTQRRFSMHMLANQSIDFFVNKPYKGLTVLHNMHITESTLLKIHALSCSGARVLVTSTPNMYSQQHVIDQLIDDGFEYVFPDNLGSIECDVALDCCASLVKQVRPRLGFVELTQTGDEIFSRRFYAGQMNLPVVSIDASHVKTLETFFGTGESFVRAIKQLCNKDLHHASVVLFGCGKVGSGILAYLLSFSKIKIHVVETCPDKLAALTQLGISCSLLSDRPSWINSVNHADYIVTATGVKHMLSEYMSFDDILNENCLLANMGSEDEFGGLFPDEMVLNDKKPVNFALPEPTLSRFLDAVFVAHNQAIDYLINGHAQPGVYPLSEERDKALVEQWLNVYFGVDKMECLFSAVLNIDPKYHTLFGIAG